MWVDASRRIKSLTSCNGVPRVLCRSADTVRWISSFRDGILLVEDSAMRFVDSSGMTMWRRETLKPWEREFLMILREQYTIVICPSSGHVVALDAYSGRVRWQKDGIYPAFQNRLEYRPWINTNWCRRGQIALFYREWTDERMAIDLLSGRHQYSMRGILTGSFEHGFIGLTLEHVEYRDQAGTLVFRDPYILIVAARGFYDIGAQLAEANPSALQTEGGDFYWANAYGVFRSRMPAGERQE